LRRLRLHQRLQLKLSGITSDATVSRAWLRGRWCGWSGRQARVGQAGGVGRSRPVSTAGAQPCRRRAHVAARTVILPCGRSKHRQCRTRPPRPCFQCGRDRLVQAEWPAGHVCVGCYEHIRRHPAPCARCQAVRPLIGEYNGTQVCGPCAGAPALDYSCRECGRSGEIHSDRRCFRCVLAAINGSPKAAPAAGPCATSSSGHTPAA
jgi:hypothetical protein